MADIGSGNSVVRSEAYVTGYDAALRQWTVHIRATFFEAISSPSTLGSSSYIVGGSAGVLASAGFSFDWRPGGLQSVVLFETDIVVTGDAAGNAPAGFHIDLLVYDTGTGGGGPGGLAQEYVSFSPNPLIVTPSAPTGASAVRNSDVQATVSWTTPGTPTNGQPTSQKVRKKVNGGAFDAGTTIAPAASVALAVAANQKLVFGVQSINGAGSSAWSADSAAIYTTPAAPTLVTATKVGSDIQLAWTPNVAFTEHQHQIEHGIESSPGVYIWDGSVLATKAAGVSSHTHVAPNPAQKHVYRVWAKNTDVAALESTKAVSNVVQLLTAPGKPNVPAPAPFQDKAAAFRFAWAHNPIDSSAQTKYQYRYSLNGGSTWAVTSSKIASANQYVDIAGGTFTANQAVTFQVRTKGAYDAGSDADASYSPWSDSVTVTFKTKPVATITTPANASTYTQATLIAVLGFSQAEAATFVSATIGLYASGGVTLIEEITSNTLAGTQFTTRLADGTSYVLKATVTDSNGITSSQVTSSFSVDYTEPVAAVVVATYLEDSGIAQLGLTIPAAGGGFAAATSVSIDRVIDGVTENIVKNYPSAPSLTILDTTPTIAGTNTYKVTTRSVDGATSVVTVELVTTEAEWAFLSSGVGYDTIVRFRSNLEVSAAPSRESKLIRTAGRVKPRALFGVGQGLTVSGKASLLTDGPESTAQEVEDFIRDADVACYRDATGRRVFGVLAGAIETPSILESVLSFTVTETG